MMRFLSRTVLLTLFVFFALQSVQPAHAQVMVGIHVSFGPPPLPVYDQPPCPEDGYIWTPGYWAYDDDNGYYWVPGTWVPAPEEGYLWTPGWWGWDDGGYYAWHEGYWGPHVGYYGGINYGFGYTGDGFWGGRWDHDHFYYNTAVMNVEGGHFRNVYRDTTVINRTTVINETHVSYNGGQGGITARPTREQESFSQERHMAPVAVQNQHMQMARGNPQLRASVNQGRPKIAATSRANEFSGRGAVPARQAGGEYHAPAMQQRGAEPGGGNAVRPAPGGRNEARPSYEARPVAPNGGNEARPENGARPAEPSHARDLQPHQMEQSPNAGNSREEQKYQQQQQKLIEKQNQEHQKLQQQQEKEDRQAQQRNFNEQRQQQVEQKHQQQTQQMEQRHQQQTERAQPRQSPPPRQSEPKEKHPQ